MAKANDIERVVEALSVNISLFPPGIQRRAEISNELKVPFSTVQQVINELAMGILKFKVPEPKKEVSQSINTDKKVEKKNV